MKRLTFIVLLITSTLGGLCNCTVSAQQELVSREELLTIVRDPESLNELLVQMDALWLVLAQASGELTTKEFPEAHKSFLDQRNRLSDPATVSAMELRSSKSKIAMIEEVLIPAIRQLRLVLVKAGIQDESRLMTTFVRAQSIFTLLLAFDRPHYKSGGYSISGIRMDAWQALSWTCGVYGLNVLCPN